MSCWVLVLSFRIPCEKDVIMQNTCIDDKKEVCCVYGIGIMRLVVRSKS
jgi:hypothetical protein